MAIKITAVETPDEACRVRQMGFFGATFWERAVPDLSDILRTLHGQGHVIHIYPVRTYFRFQSFWDRLMRRPGSPEIDRSSSTSKRFTVYVDGIRIKIIRRSATVFDGDLVGVGSSFRYVWTEREVNSFIDDFRDRKLDYDKILGANA